jgi:hypothetical protein
MAMPAAQSAGVASLPRASVGTASGVYAMLRQLGGVAGVAVTAAAFAGAGGYTAFSAGITRAMVVCGVLSLAGALAGLGISARRTVEVRG